MSVFRTEEGSDHWDLSEDPLVENLVACMICKVVGETLGLSGADELEPEPPQEPLQEPPQEPPPYPEGKTEVVQIDPTLDMPRKFY